MRQVVTKNTGFARNGSEAEYPNLWRRLVFATAAPLNGHHPTYVWDFSHGYEHATLTNSATWVGDGVEFTANLDARATVVSARLPTLATDHWTVQGFHRTSANSSLTQIFGFGSSLATGATYNDGSNRYLLSYLNDYYYWGSNADWDTGIAIDVDSQVHSWAFKFDGTTLSFHRDGVRRAERTGMPTNTTTAQVYVTAGGRHSSGSAVNYSRVSQGLIYSRALHDKEIWRLHALGPGGFATPRKVTRIVPEQAVVASERGGFLTLLGVS